MAAVVRSADAHDRRPVYVIEADEATGVVDLGATALACTHPLHSFDFRPLLEAAGAWNGWGFCLVIRERAFPVRPVLYVTALHEYAHDVLARGRLEEIFSQFPHLADDPQCTAPRQDLKCPTAADRHRPWDEHAAPFVRVLIHAVWRANLSGWMLDIDDAYPTDIYLLSQASRYAEALGGEPERMRDKPLLHIAATDPPARFQEFARQDLEHAERRYQQLLKWGFFSRSEHA